MEDITKYKQILSTVAAHTNQAFLTFLLDFLKAIGKEKRKEFFYENKKTIDTLAHYYYDEFKKAINEDRNEWIKKYKLGICKKTGTKKWWIYHDLVLGTYIKEDAPRIGIECVFEDETSDNPLGDFHIYVATWDEPDFGQYKQAIKEIFPNKEKPKHEKRIFIPVGQYKHDDLNGIIHTLSVVYKELNKIINS
ncbi:MAG: hypothetical protein K2I87_00125 [Bacteroidales bacterium]|nr:hypothetical protein [Bacteroidales bacterium]